jgi:tetratricopeptide (TPR) repeat protein
MESGRNPAHSISKRKAKLYISLSVFFLFLLALLWSVDASLIYLFTGACIFFLYKGLATVGLRWRNDNTFARSSNESNRDADLAHELNTIFKEQSHAEFTETQQRPNKPHQGALVIASVIFLFILVVFIGIFSGGDSDADEAFVQQADIFYNTGNYDSAQLYYRKALAANPDHIQALLGYGNGCMVKEQYDSAIFMYDKIIAVDRDFDEAHYQKGLVLYYQKNYDQAIVEMTDLISRDPSHSEAMQVIGDCYYNMKRYDMALRWYDQAYANGLRNRYLCHLMGFIYETNGDKQKAIQLYKEALAYDDSVLDIYMRLGALLPDEPGKVYRDKAKELEVAQEGE